MNHRRDVIFYFFLCIVFASVTFMFYASPLRSKVEDYFYDMRVRMQIGAKDVDNIVLVTIDENTIDKLEGPYAEDLSAENMIQLIQQIQKSKAKEIVAIYLSNSFEYDAPETRKLVDVVKDDPRVTVGTLGLNFRSPFFIDFPNALNPITKRVRGIETFKARSTDIVRDMPFYSYRGINRMEQLPLYLARKQGVRIDTKRETFRLNYLRPEQFKEIPAEEVLSHATPKTVFDNQIVILGYKAYRKWPAQTYDPMLVNTPLRGSPNSYLDGEAIIYLTAVAIENLVNRRFLLPAPVWLTVAQVLVVTMLFALIWKFGPIVGSILTTTFFLLLLQGHAIIFEFLSLQIPFSDTFIFASFAVILGVVGNLRSEIQKYGDIRAKVKADHELDRLQSRFLDQFANGVSSLNAELLNEAVVLAKNEDLTKTERKLVGAAIESGHEFEDFLSGIKQLASTSGDNKLTNPVHSNFKLIELIKRVLSRFDQNTKNKNIVVQVSVAEDLTVHSSYEILDTILYNLLSNAIKYSPSDSAIKIVAETVDGVTRISVVDEGPGVPKNLQDRIFEKFYRIKDDNVYKIKGTGIGLYLTKFFAEKINASIAVRSNQGRGATFYVDIKS